MALTPTLALTPNRHPAGTRPVEPGGRGRSHSDGASARKRRPRTTGEALGRAAVLNLGLVNRVPEHRRIEGVRNRVIHGYDAVDDETVCRHESS